MQITPQMRVLVAGMACLMILRPGAALFPALRQVLIYPGPFLVPVSEPDEFGLVAAVSGPPRDALAPYAAPAAREERLEDVLHHLVRHAAAVIFHHQLGP